MIFTATQNVRLWHKADIRERSGDVRFWGKALRFALVWLAGMFAPLASKTLLELPNWVAVTWMIVWAFLGYIFAPYGMWKAQRKK